MNKELRIFRSVLSFSVLLVSVLNSIEAQAQLISYSFSGQINEVSQNDGNVIPNLSVGDSFAGFVQFESTGWNGTDGTLFVSINGVQLFFDGASIFGEVNFAPSSSYSIRIAGDTGGDIGDSTFSAFNFGPELIDSDGSAEIDVPFPAQFDLAEFETKIFRIAGEYRSTGDRVSATGTLTSFALSADASTLLGDVNLDGAVDFSDIPVFISLLQSGQFQAEADADLSGLVDFLDIFPFVYILISQ
jgi:hypothetical protein